MINWGDIPLGTVIPFPFAAFGSSGESLTLSGLATTDIEVYKGTSMTQRASDNGFALLDTDGIDIDTRTGIHGFSIDTGDNSDSGFYAAGSLYYVVVDAVTINSQTVRFVAGTFRLTAAESVAGVPEVDVTHFNGTAGTFASGRPEVNASHIAGSAVSTSSAQIGVNVVNAGGTAWGSGAITAASIAADAITAAKIANGAIDAATFAADVDAEILSYLVDDATRIDASALNTATGTTIPAILTDTAEIGAAGAGLTAVPWNASWDAEVQSEVQDAIEANHLDHLLAATYDPASKPGAADALLNELVESDAGVARFTANALEQGPSGSGPSAADIRAEIDANSTQLAAILADTADMQPKLGTPAGASISADIAAVKSQTAAIETDTQDLQTQVGTAGAGLTGLPEVDADVKKINGTTVTGDGTSSTPWGPA